MVSPMKSFNVTDSDSIPAIGLGTWKAKSGTVGKAVTTALNIGYRHIDCASIYNNQKEIGNAITKCLDGGTVKRENLWVTSKLWNNAHAARHVRPALERTLKDLNLQYLDLYLIHWPVHFRANITFPKGADGFIAEEEIPVMETWTAMEKLVKKGLIRFIGVCNFSLRRLKKLQEQAHIKPVMNQIELHPYLQQQPMLDYCESHDIQITAYSPLGSPDRPANLKKADEPSLLQNPVIWKIAREKAISPAQLLLSWALHRKTIVIPKSVNPTRLRKNFEAQELTLSPEQMELINTLDLNHRFIDGSFFQGSGSPYTTEDIWA